MTSDPWQLDRLDLDAYLKRIGVPARAPSRAALDELHEAHVRTFTFDNIDVLLDQHPGVSLEAVQAKFVGRGRGGYCFEHSTLLAAALERLGYTVTRRLGRVGDPTQVGRTHCVVVVTLDGQRLLADPGFGLSLLRPIPLEDGATDDHGGWRYQVRRASDGDATTWQLLRWRDGGWELMHTHDELRVHPIDLVCGHHYTSTFPTATFRQGLMLTRHLPDRHVSLTTDTVTVRRPGQPTEHRTIDLAQLRDLVHELGVPLSPAEEERLWHRVAQLRGEGSVPPAPWTRPTRHPELMPDDRAQLDALFESTVVGHVGFVDRGRPVVIPTLVTRCDDRLIIHGSTGSRWLGHLAAGTPVSVSLAAGDGVPVARSADESARRYRSAVLFGQFTELHGQEKVAALDAITERTLPGRVAQVRHPTAREVAATMVLAMPIREWSLRRLDGWPEDPAEDVRSGS